MQHDQPHMQIGQFCPPQDDAPAGSWRPAPLCRQGTNLASRGSVAPTSSALLVSARLAIKAHLHSRPIGDGAVYHAQHNDTSEQGFSESVCHDALRFDASSSASRVTVCVGKRRTEDLLIKQGIALQFSAAEAINRQGSDMLQKAWPPPPCHLHIQPLPLHDSYMTVTRPLPR